MFLHENLLANGGAGSPITLGRIIVAKAIFDFITNDSLSAIVVNDGGDGYAVGETFDIVMNVSPGDVTEIFTARGVVVSVGSGSPSASPDGSVTRVKITSGGSFRSLAGSPQPSLTGLATTNSSAAGDNTMTVDITVEPANWTEERGDGLLSPIPSTDFVDGETDFEWIATSTKSTNPPTVGLDTAESGGNGALQLMVSTGFDNSQTFFSQPDASPGGPKIMTPGTDPEIYISSTERRVNIMIRDGSFVQYGTIGFFIPFTDTEANYPFPGIIAGQSTGFRPFTQSYTINSASPAVANAGFVHPMTLQDGTVGSAPYRLRDNVSPAWKVLNNQSNQSTVRPLSVWPHHSRHTQMGFTYAPQVDGFDTDPSTGWTHEGIIEDDENNTLNWFGTDAGGPQGVPGIGALGLNNRLSFVVQPHFMQDQTNDVQVIGLTDGFEVVHGIGLTAFEELVQHNGKRYIAFPDTNGSDNHQWTAMEIN